MKSGILMNTSGSLTTNGQWCHQSNVKTDTYIDSTGNNSYALKPFPVTLLDSSNETLTCNAWLPKSMGDILGSHRAISLYSVLVTWLLPGFCECLSSISPPENILTLYE